MFAPKYTITNKILLRMGEIEAARETVEFAPLVSEWEEKFRQDALGRTVYFGTHLEGSDLTLAGCEKIVKEEPGRDEAAEEVAKRLAVVGRERDVQMAMNYRNVAKFCDQLARLGRKTGITITEKESFQVHSLMMERVLPSNQLGIYRIGAVSEKLKNHLARPLPVEVPYQIEDFWIWIKNYDRGNNHPVLMAGIALAELTRIGPFTDGNGAVARTISNLLLAINGYDNKRFFCIEDYLDKNYQEYEVAVGEAAANGEFTSWLEFYTTALAGEMTRIKESVRRLSLDSLNTTTNSQQVALTERQLALLSAFKMKDELTMTEARRILPMVSDDTILRDLTSLVGKKLIKRRGNTKGARYILKR